MARRNAAPPSRRVHEVFGIVTLAAALLLGPSLVSVQAGDGLLMGPFGQAVGTALNWALGLGGYLAVAALLVIAIRIFAEGLVGESEGPQAPWRERIGAVALTFFGTALLHLAGHPRRVAGASLGGVVGEVGAETLRALVFAPGAWVLALAGVALALVLATNLSLARTGVALFRLARRGCVVFREGVGQSRRHLTVACVQLAQVLSRREVAAEAHGAAVLPPPIIRLDLSEVPAEKIGDREPDRPEGPAEPMPEDLEIGVAASLPPPVAAPPEICMPDPPLLEATGDAMPGDAMPAGAEASETETGWVRDVLDAQVVEAAQVLPPPVELAPDAGAESPVARLTIVEPQFKDEAVLPSPEDAPDEKRVEQGDGPGFVLFGDTYRPPPISLLEYEETEESTIDRDAIYRQAERLVKTLADYKIEGRVTEVHPGPVVTMYEFVPAPGTRISKISNLANDLAMSLAAQRVRIVAPIPGKGAVGIEVPNERRENVYFKEIVAHDSFRKGKAALPLALGKTIVGAPVTMDLAKMPHLLVAGATGAGKSVSINAMICSLLLRSTPEEVRFIMVDPKYLELSGYNDIPHLMLPVVTDPKKANFALRWAVNEMERRYQLLAEMRVRDIVAYNRKVEKIRGEASSPSTDEGASEEARRPVEPIREAPPAKIILVRKNPDGSEEPLSCAPPAGLEVEARPDADSDGGDSGPWPENAPADAAVERDRRRRGRLPRKLPYIVVVIDEFADLMMVASKDVETSVARLAQKARAAGIHVILATQRPSVDVITGLIKANFPSRISFQVASGHDSKTILGVQGAENLLGSGDMLVLDRGAEMKRIHGAYISDQEIRRVVDWLKDQGRPVYDMEILKPPEDEETELPESDGADEMYDQAVALVAETRQASISMIQRRLRVGYNRAARMVERMEREGIVSAPDGVKGREVLIQHHQGT